MWGRSHPSCGRDSLVSWYTSYMTSVQVIKADGTREEFLPEKLLQSLARSGADSEVSEHILRTVEAKIHDGMKTSDIYKNAFSLLHEMKSPVARTYSLRRAVMELGPSGFPFEDFVAQILKRKGYEVKTREVALGECVEHEVDVVAWNDRTLIMAEAKFHNELGVKSDLKVALYVKARIDDLKGTTFTYGGRERTLDEGWLITNTKFTSTAIHYAECKGLTLLGWNYPARGNLQDLILETKVHPITCLVSLSGTQKRSLLSRGVVLCSDLISNPEYVKGFGFSDQKIKKLFEEIHSL